MLARLFLPALWLLSLLLSMPHLQAQDRPLGPWRLTYQMVSKRADSDDWGPVKPGKKVLKLVPTAVKWNVSPDSIRLFLNCENPLIAPVQPRKGQLPIRFTATGATVRLDAKRNQLLIVPSAATVTLNAYRGRKTLFKREFKVVPPPLPIVEPWLSNLRNATWCKGPRLDSTLATFALSVKAVSDDSFAEFMPNDALYRVSTYQVILLHDGIPDGPAQVVAGPQASIERPKALIHLGDQLQIDVQRVQRKNFRGDVEDLLFTKQLVVALPL